MHIWLDTSFVAVITAVAVVILGSNGATTSSVYDYGTTTNITDIPGEIDVDLVVVANFIVV